MPCSWIGEGLALFAALARVAPAEGRGPARAETAEAIEVFPTASWTRWFGRRGGESRASWTRRGLRRLGLRGLPDGTNQDERDAIAAAVTARQHMLGLTESIGDIVVPTGRWPQDERLF